MSKRPEFQRRIYVIDRDFQFRYLLTWLAMTMSLLGGMVLLTLVTFLFLRDTFVMRYFIELNAGLAVIITGISLLVMVRHSHRIAGPAYRLQRILREIAAGTYDLSSEVRLRRKDYLKHVAEALNDLIEVRRVEKKHLGELVEWLGHLDDAVQTSQDSTPEIKALSARLRATADDIAGPHAAPGVNISSSGEVASTVKSIAPSSSSVTPDSSRNFSPSTSRTRYFAPTSPSFVGSASFSFVTTDPSASVASESSTRPSRDHAVR